MGLVYYGFELVVNSVMVFDLINNYLRLLNVFLHKSILCFDYFVGVNKIIVGNYVSSN